jgi:hypothetical protein
MTNETRTLSTGYVMRQSAQERRDEAIQAIVDHFIGQYGDELGKLVAPARYTDLQRLVLALRTQGRSYSWLRGITRWEECIYTAHKAFCDQNGLSYINGEVWQIDETHFTHTTGREWISSFKWAVQQGAIYASNANR